MNSFFRDDDDGEGMEAARECKQWIKRMKLQNCMSAKRGGRKREILATSNGFQ
jgi:hypothetical protein